MSKIYRWFLISFLAFSSLIGSSQTNSNSPYSYYGIGDLEALNSGRTSGMGGVGIGIKSGLSINRLNPASYSGIDSLFFLFDVNVFGNSSKFESKQDNYHVISGNINKIAIGFRLSPRFAASLGIVPFSSVSYTINTKKWVEGTTTRFDILSKGEGGLNKLYLGSSYKINNHHSFGINASLLFGSIKKSEEYTYYLFDNYWKSTEKITPNSSLYFDFGYQYANSLNSKMNYTIGLIGGLKTKLKFSKYTINETDTTTYTTEKLEDVYNFWIPAYLGLGFSLSSEKWTVAADYRMQKWGDMKEKNDLKNLSNSSSFAVGMEYVPNRRLGRTFFEKVTYQAGFHYDKSYLRINSVDIKGYGVSVGLGIPIHNQLSSINVSFETGVKGNYSNDLFRERYSRINLSVNLNDIWFQKRKFK